MGQDNYQTALLRLLAAEMWMHISMNAARELFGKSYFALGIAERTALDQLVVTTIGANYSGISPEFLRVPQPSITGFQPQFRQAD